MHAAAGRHAHASGHLASARAGARRCPLLSGAPARRRFVARPRGAAAAGDGASDGNDAAAHAPERLLLDDEALASVLEDPPYIMVNSCTGRMGHAAAEAIVRAGLPLVPYTLTGYSAGVAVGGVGVAGIPVEVVGKESRQEALEVVKRQYGGGGGGGDGSSSSSGGASSSAGRLIIVDYTTPAAALDNARFYARNGVPFVMGTTGADAELVAAAAREAGVPALVAPQMGKQVVALQAALQMAAEAFPGAFSGYELDVVESHQASKVDVSGTAREVVRSLRALGGRFAAEREQRPQQEERDGTATAATPAQGGGAGGGGGGTAGGGSGTSGSSGGGGGDPAWHVRRVRDRATQQSPAIGVPYDALGGHAYHTYTLSSPGAPPLPPLLAAGSGSGGGGGEQRRRQQQQQQQQQQKMAAAAAAAANTTPAAAGQEEQGQQDPDAGSWSRFVFKHNVVGREVYAQGTADAVLFLAAIARAGAGKGGGQGQEGRVFDMVDVLRAGDLRERAARALAARDAAAAEGEEAAEGGGRGRGGAEAGGGAKAVRPRSPSPIRRDVSPGSAAAARRANSPSVAAAAAASAAATRSAKEQRAKAAAAAGEGDA